MRDPVVSVASEVGGRRVDHPRQSGEQGIKRSAVAAEKTYLSGAAHLVDGGVIRYLRLVEMTDESGEHGDRGEAWPGLLGRCHRAMAIDWPVDAGLRT